MPETAADHQGRRSARQRIIEAATELFSTRGYAATTTRDIADKVGIRQPSLYSHFKVKADILVEVELQTFRPTLDLFATLVADESLTALERLARLVEFDVRMLCDGPWNVALLGYLPEVRNEGIAHGMADHGHELYQAYRVLVHGALTESGRSEADPDTTTEVVFSLVDGMILRRVHNPRLDGGRLAPAVREAVLAMVR
ncbi:TetR/AcrR family transcriptional regulator [Kineosporia sp. J2-2]|uniref:TetR/AcrR family transcriptional regulator n=1 Tax=Kineosporia corallincola TaxID=2835133 RepID=A0ABS5TKG7_9ACTN|nr:TetR/AcrR family transcriptional regulator [Kineosporia corallincola]MBT0770079.1 TetR/AcrR family transcriptional regulator [Kineosporia corallincola]